MFKACFVDQPQIKEYWDALPFDEWILYDHLPAIWFTELFAIINTPMMRPYVWVIDNDETTAFKKIKKEKNEAYNKFYYIWRT